MAERIFTCY